MVKKKMTYCFDIDGVVCTNTEGKYREAQPLYNHINHINKLKKEKNVIYLQTARGATTGINWRKVTEKQLKLWGVKYDKLFFQKPTANFYIDDKGVNSNEFFKK